MNLDLSSPPRVLPKLNVELLDEALNKIAANPQNHNQSSWATRGPECGTTMCLGGWVTQMTMPDGCEFTWTPSPFMTDDETAFGISDAEGCWRDSVGSWAAEQLGLTAGERELLFHRCSTLEDLRAARDCIVEARAVRGTIDGGRA